MGQFIDLTGQRFGRLTVTGRAPDHFTKSGTRITMWRCACDCGECKDIAANALRKGATKSCGCYSTEVKRARTSERNRKMATQNGSSREKLFHVWNAIRHRCYFVTDDYYHLYGGRGIAMCDEWKESYFVFKEWALSNGYKDGLTIDRIDVNGNYDPSNCRWATLKEQANNRRSNRRFTAFGRTLNIQQWAELLEVPYNKLRYRLVEKGLSVQGALNDMGLEVMAT